MLELREEIESDLSVFHRIEHPEEMPASRYFRLAGRLAAYGGAVAGAFARVLAEEETKKRANAVPEGVSWVEDDGPLTNPSLDGKTLEALQPDPAFPGIEFTDGG